MSKFTIAFDIVQARCHQRVELVDDSYTEETLIEGLNEGRLVTTTWHDGSGTNATIDNLRTGGRVAVIHEQEIDGEYEDFC